jgi:hypothetical protein
MERIGIPLFLVILVALPGLADEPVRETAFAEIVVQIDQAAMDGMLSAYVDSIFYLGEGERELVEGSLRVGCDIGLADWFFTVEPGLELTLIWEMVTPPTRGWLFFGGKGGEVRLSLPEDGWPADCQCKDKDDEEAGRLYGAIRGNSGVVLENLRLAGDSEIVPLRLLPFWKGRDPVPPKTLRLVLSWEPLT